MSIYVIGKPQASVLSGVSLAHRKLDARQRAAIVAQILLGEKAFSLSKAQLMRLLGVNWKYVGVALELSSYRREGIINGKDETSFALLANHKQPRLSKAASI
jgi:hypothetical protein